MNPGLATGEGGALPPGTLSESSTRASVPCALPGHDECRGCVSVPCTPEQPSNLP